MAQLSAHNHCTFSCVLQIDTILSRPGDPKFCCIATIQTSVNTRIDNVDDCYLSVEVEYYNVFGEPFLENAMIFCIGSLCVTEEGTADPVLSVRTHCLIRFIKPHYLAYILHTLTKFFFFQRSWRPLRSCLSRFCTSCHQRFSQFRWSCHLPPHSAI
jgi:hypothetical protein